MSCLKNDRDQQMSALAEIPPKPGSASKDSLDMGHHSVQPGHGASFRSALDMGHLAAHPGHRASFRPGWMWDIFQFILDMGHPSGQPGCGTSSIGSR